MAPFALQEAVLKLIELVEPGLGARGGKVGDASGATRLRALLQRAPAHLLADLFSASFSPALSRAQQLQVKRPPPASCFRPRPGCWTGCCTACVFSGGLVRCSVE